MVQKNKIDIKNIKNNKKCKKKVNFLHFLFQSQMMKAFFMVIIVMLKM